MRNELRAAMLAILASVSTTVIACGYCVEDRVAAVYDHDAVESAIAKHRHVAFFSIEGDLRQDEASRRALVAAVDGGGAVKGSARVALENAAVSVAYDPARTTLESLTRAANEPLAKKGLVLEAIRVIDEAGKLREP